MAYWDYHKVMDLIGLYEDEPVLWDPNHPTFEHERKSNEAWERIIAGMGTDYKVEGLKLVIASLKQMYHQHKRENTIPYDEDDNGYFHRLDPFLGKTYITTADSTQVQKIGDTEDVKVALDQTLRDITKDLATTKDDVKELTQQVVNLQLENNTLREEANDASRRKNAKREKSDPTNEMVKLATARLQQPQDDNDKVAAAWAVGLRKMDPEQQLFAEKAINDILFEGQMGTLHRDSVQINASRVSTPHCV